MTHKFIGARHNADIRNTVYVAGSTAALESGYNRNPRPWPKGPGITIGKVKTL